MCVAIVSVKKFMKGRSIIGYSNQRRFCGENADLKEGQLLYAIRQKAAHLKSDGPGLQS